MPLDRAQENGKWAQARSSSEFLRAMLSMIGLNRHPGQIDTIHLIDRFGGSVVQKRLDDAYVLIETIDDDLLRVKMVHSLVCGVVSSSTHKESAAVTVGLDDRVYQLNARMHIFDAVAIATHIGVLRGYGEGV